MPEAVGEDASGARMVGWEMMLNMEVCGRAEGRPPVVAVKRAGR